MDTHEGAATVADLLSDGGSEHPDFVDPVIDEEVSRLETASASFQAAFDAKQWAESHTALLNVCRYGQRVRLEIGRLIYLDRSSRARTVNALQRVVNLLMNAAGQAAPKPLDKKAFEQKIGPYLQRFSGNDQSWARRAALNILERLEEAEELVVAEKMASAAPTTPK